jgi:hypothetical protein
MRISMSIVLLFLLYSQAYSHQIVTVVPLNQKVTSMKNVVTVSESGGDFQDIASALDSITDANTNNPYTIMVGPGKYSITGPIIMKDSVSLLGAGRTATTLTGNISVAGDAPASSIIVAANNSTISGLTIINSGGAGYVVGISSKSATNSSIHGVNLEISGGTISFGIVDDSGELDVSDVDITTSGASNQNNGVSCTQSQSQYKNINITQTASGNTLSWGFDLQNGCSLMMNDISVTGSGGYETEGISSSGTSSFTCNSCQLDSQGGSNGGVGVFQNTSGTATISNSTIKADSTGVFAYGGTVTISNSNITSTVVTDDNSNTATMTCLYVGGNNKLLDLDCAIIP